MLNKFTIKRFKSYDDASLSLGPLSVLIGANASGKSNALEALRLMSWIAKGNKLNAIKYAIQEGSEAVRGRVNDLPQRDNNTFRFEADAPLSQGIYSQYRWSSFSISLGTTTDDELFIVDERVESKQTTVPLYEVVERPQHPGHDVLVAYNNFARGGIKPKVYCTDQQAAFIQLESSARYASSHRETAKIIPHVSRNLQQFLGGIQFLDPSPKQMRNYSFKSESELHQDGRNLSGVLFHICQNERFRSEVLDFVKNLPEQHIDQIDFITTPREEVMVQLSETFGDRTSEFDATLLSDGTLRVLGIAAMMLSAPDGSLVVIEEIDNGVHPSRAELLLRKISDLAKAKNLRVLLSTHNPALLDALPVDAVPDVTFCYRDPETGASRLVKLSDLRCYPELISKGTLGHLLTSGIIDKFVKSNRSQAARSSKARQFFSSLD